MSTASHHIPTLIIKKRDGKPLTDDEINFLIDAITNKRIDQAQIGALLMAIRLKDMSYDETAQLTKSMTESGFKFTWPEEWRHLVVDKHSTGGVGDKVTLVLTPALAACGLKVPTITGRGLSHTGGTLDKLESIPGFSCSLTSQQIIDIVTDIGCCFAGQTGDVAPADKVLYATRDVTGTVDSVPLITGSILSKKIAENLTALVIDVKLGKASVFPDEDYVRRLAHSMVSVGNLQGVQTTAVLSRMDSPIGNMVGNALEIVEVIKCLHGGGPRPLVNLISDLGGHLLYNVKQAASPTEGAAKISRVLQDGSALGKFKNILKSQGVATEVADALCAENADVLRLLEEAPNKTQVTAQQSGYITEINALTCAHVSMALGAGRRNAEDVLDYKVGLEFVRHVGDLVQTGDHVMTIHHSGPLASDTVPKLQNAITVHSTRPSDEFINNLIIEVINN